MSQCRFSAGQTLLQPLAVKTLTLDLKFLAIVGGGCGVAPDSARDRQVVGNSRPIELPGIMPCLGV